MLGFRFVLPHPVGGSFLETGVLKDWVGIAQNPTEDYWDFRKGSLEIGKRSPGIIGEKKRLGECY